MANNQSLADVKFPPKRRIQIQRIVKVRSEPRDHPQPPVIETNVNLAVASLGISPRGVKLSADQNSGVVKGLKLGFCYTYIQNSRVVN